MIGATRMPDDPCADKRGQIEFFEKFLDAMQQTAESLLSACLLLESRPPAFLESLATVFGSVNSPGAAGVAKITEELSGFVRSLQAGHVMLNEMLALTRGMRSEITTALEIFKGRDAAFETKSHYDAKLSRLQGDLAKRPSDSKLSKKVARNEQKQRDSEENFHRVMEVTQSVADAVISKLYSGTEAAVAKMCRFYLVLAPGPPAFKDVRQFAEHFDRPVTPVVSRPAG